MLALAFLGSVLLAVLKTGRWKVILISVAAVWAMRVSPAEIDLLAAGTNEGYAWFTFLSAGTGFLALVVSAIGTDMGAALLDFFQSRNMESEEIPD